MITLFLILRSGLQARARYAAMFCLLAMLVAGKALAGPFGLNKGASLTALKEYGLERVGTTNIYRAKSVPKPDAQFEDYVLVVTPEDGLCKVMAMSSPISTSASGDGIKGQFAAIRDSLATRFGKGQDYDYLRAGSMWTEPKDWMYGLLMQERVLATFWGDAKFPDGIDGITLEAKATTNASGSITVSYQFDNFGSCKAKSQKK